MVDFVMNRDYPLPLPHRRNLGPYPTKPRNMLTGLPLFFFEHAHRIHGVRAALASYTLLSQPGAPHVAFEG